jgi:hypothetical protein
MSEEYIEFTVKGDYSHILNTLESIKTMSIMPLLHKYGRKGVEYLQNATPVDTGRTRDSWSYEIDNSKEGQYKIQFVNDNINKGINIAILLEYGHATINGGWVEGKNYIDPAVSAAFEEMVEELTSKIRRY